VKTPNKNRRRKNNDTHLHGSSLENWKKKNYTKKKRKIKAYWSGSVPLAKLRIRLVISGFYFGN